MLLGEDKHQTMQNRRIGSVFGCTPVYLAISLSIACSGCGKKDSTTKTATPNIAATANTDEEIDLVALNALLRKYVVWKKQVPKDMSELVTSGFITNLPSPPPGKRLLIDRNPFGYQVVLADAQETR